MRNIRETIAGRWFLSENKYRMYSGTIPKNVIVSLSKLSDKELSLLAYETCLEIYLSKFLSDKNVMEDPKFEMGEDDFDNYMEKYKEENFPKLDSEKDVVFLIAEKIKSLFSVLVFWHQGFIDIVNNFDLFDISEMRALLENNVSASRKKVKSTNVDKNKKNQMDETSIFNEILELLKVGDLKSVRELNEILKNIKKRLN